MPVMRLKSLCQPFPIKPPKAPINLNQRKFGQEGFKKKKLGNLPYPIFLKEPKELGKGFPRLALVKKKLWEIRTQVKVIPKNNGKNPGHPGQWNGRNNPPQE